MKKELINIGNKSKKAITSQLNSKKKNKVLKDYCDLIKKNKKLIINQNKKDIFNAQKKGLKKNLIDRLILEEKKISNIISSIKSIIRLKDPTNIVLEKWNRPNGLNISKISIPIGIIVIEVVFLLANLANLYSPSLRTNFSPYLLIFPSGKTTSCSCFSIRSIAYLNAERDGDN